MAVTASSPTGPPTAFVDTTVMVAAAVRAHPHHHRSNALLAALPPATGFCAAHALVELYATLAALPLMPRIHPADAAAAVRHRAQTLQAITLSAEEQMQAVLSAAEHGASARRVYDALTLAAAAKSGADIIYTWDIRHFERVADQALARRLRVP